MSNTNLLDKMLDSVNGVEAIFMKFINIKNTQHKDCVFCFFEGKDDYKYYGSRIKLYTERDTIIYDCDGKENVLLLHGMITSNVDNSDENHLLFFIDRDFDMNTTNCLEIYTTPCYSIENFYITDEAFCEFLKGELGLSKYSLDEDKIDYDNVLNYYKNKRKQFISDSILINAWYSLQKNKSIKIPQKDKPDLSKLKHIKDINIPINIEKLEELTDRHIVVTNIEIENEKNRLMKDPIYNLRGKYYEEFLFSILNLIISDSNKPNLIFKKKRKVKLTIGRDNLISILSQYADTPKSLKYYIENRLLMTNTKEKLKMG